MRRVSQYFLLSTISILSIKSQIHASTREFLEDYRKIKGTSERILNVRSNLEDYSAPQIDKDFSEKLGTYISTGDVEGKTYQILDRSATSQELEDYFKLFLASAFRGEKLSQVFAEQVDKHTDKRIKAHIQGAQFFAKMAEDFYLDLDASEEEYKGDYGFNPAEIARNYHTFKDDLEDIRQKDRDWHKALEYTRKNGNEGSVKQLEQRFKNIQDKTKSLIWEKLEENSYYEVLVNKEVYKNSHNFDSFKDFETKFVNFFYNNIDESRFSLSDLHPDGKDFPLNSESRKALFETARTEDLKELDDQEDFSNSWVIRRLSIPQNFTYIISQFNSKYCTERLWHINKKDSKRLSDPAKKEFLQEDIVIDLQAIISNEWAEEPYLPFSKQQADEIIKEKLSLTEEVEKLYNIYIIYDSFITKYEKTLQIFKEEICKKIKSEWLKFAKEERLTEQTILRYLYEKLESKLFTDLKEILGPIEPEDLTFIKTESEHLLKAIKKKLSLPTDYDKQLKEIVSRLNNQPLRPLTDLEITSIIVLNLKEKIERVHQDSLIRQKLEDLRSLFSLPTNEFSIEEILKDSIKSYLESNLPFTNTRADKGKRLGYIDSVLQAIIKYNSSLITTFKEELTKIQDRKIWNNKDLDSNSSYSSIKKEFIKSIQDIFKIYNYNLGHSLICYHEKHYTQQLLEVVNNYVGEVSNKIINPYRG